MEVLAQQVTPMSVFGRLFGHHSLVTDTCPQIWLIWALMHQPAPFRHHKIMLACALLQPRLPSQWRKIVCGAILVDLFEQLLRELLFFSRPLCLRASDCHYRSLLANSNSW